MPIIVQSKGLQHCRDIKREALNFWHLTGGKTKDLKECIKMALVDHVKLLQEEEEIIQRLQKREAPHMVRVEDHLMGY